MLSFFDYLIIHNSKNFFVSDQKQLRFWSRGITANGWVFLQAG